MALEEALNLQSFGKYELIVSLGRGGMASVYLALVAGPGRFNKLLVLKILRADALASAEEGVSMFLDEARLSARLVHPNIVHTYEVGENDGRYFIAMEYLDGQSYRALQQRTRAMGGAIPIHEELRIISETARGLQYAHELKGYHGEPLHVVHRDVSPQNVFITYDGQVKLLDFGIAKTADAEHMTRVGVIKGKLEYIAPEQIHGESVDRRADVFSLGVMLWEAITGQRFAGGPKESEVKKVHKRITAGEPNVRSVQPDVPEPLARIVDRALALRPEARWPDAGTFADALDDYLEASGHKPGAKSLASFVAPLFEDLRVRTSKLIEQQIEKVRERGSMGFGEHTGSLPRLRFGEESTSGMYLGGHAEVAQHVEAAPRSLAPLRAGGPKRAQRWTLALVAGSALVLGAGARLLIGGERDAPVASGTLATSPAVAPVASAVAQPAPSAPQVAPVPELASPVMSLNLRVTPSDARVTLDGVPLATPFAGRFRRDAALHQLEVVADGYRSSKQLVAFDKDRALEVALEREPERADARERDEHRASAMAPRRPRAVEREQAPVVHDTPTSEPKAAAPAVDDNIQPGADLKGVKPRVLRGQLDEADPYSSTN